MLSSSLAAYMDAKVLDVMFQRVFDINPSLFLWNAQGSFKVLGVKWDWSLDVQVPSAPTATFGPQPAAAPYSNVGFQLAIDIVVHIGIAGLPPLDLNLSLGAALTGSLDTEDNQIVLDDLRVNLTWSGAISLTDAHKRAGLTSEMVQRTVTQLVAPGLEEFALRLPLPQIHDLFGSDLDAALTDVGIVRDGVEYVMCATAELSRHDAAVRGRLAPPAPPPEARLGDNAGKIVLVVSERALNLVAGLIDGHSYRFRETGRTLGIKYGVKGRIVTDRIHIRVPGLIATASARVSFKRPRTGIKFCGCWVWVPVDIKGARAAMNVSLFALAGGRTGNLVFQGIRKVDIELRHGFCDIPVRALDDLLNDVIDDFLPIVNRWFRGRSIELFNLPATIPGTQIPAGLDFGPDGLSFSRGMVVAEVMVTVPGA